MGDQVVPVEWTDAAIEDLFEGSFVFGRDELAVDVPLPEHLRLEPSPTGRLWFESTSEILFEDRVGLVETWNGANARPGVPVEVDIRRNVGSEWFLERITMLNLLDHPVGAVLVGVRRLAEVDEPVRRAVDLQHDLPEIATVRRPTWALQELDALGRILCTEGDVREIFGVTAEELEGRIALEVLHPDDHPTCLEMWTDLLAHPRSLRHVTQRVVRPDGTVCWIESNVINHLAADGTGSILSILHDITERRGQERELVTQARADALTGLPNRSAFVAALQRQLQEGPVVVGFVDLDGFKAVNDTHGHLVGDAVLDVVAQRLAGRIHAPAVVGRWGGDEFVILCPMSPPAALEGAVRQALADPISVHDVVWPARASVGLVAGAQGDDAEDLLRSADRAMYEQKIAKRS